MCPFLYLYSLRQEASQGRREQKSVDRDESSESSASVSSVRRKRFSAPMPCRSFFETAAHFLQHNITEAAMEMA